jgi:hypothetical protein
MSGRQEATKGAEDCDKLGGAVKRALIPKTLEVSRAGVGFSLTSRGVAYFHAWQVSVSFVRRERARVR